MKKLTTTLFALLFVAATVWAQGTQKTLPVENSATVDIGVVINGVTWATRNVDAPGTFAATPENAGMFYQWNRKKAWSATEPMINSNGKTKWQKKIPKGSQWEKNNDPSPKGWRVPTTAEQQSLLDESKVTNEWVIQNGVKGRLFTDKFTGNQLFLPAAGFRVLSNGKRAGTKGSYWVSTANKYDKEEAYYLDFDERDTGVYSCKRSFGFCVRAVAE